ncbi:MAG: DUF805 domain-containing protein [Candidatus Bipolaricaulota bacterium]|nr:DUF805 domain-containing protein [Candidatus Bipolaricaulota bacterium]
MTTFFSMRGRYRRATYFWLQLGILVVVYGVPFSLGFAKLLPTGWPATAIFWAVLLVGNLLSALQIVKRLHDLDRPGMHYGLLLVPLYDLYLVLVLFLRKGNARAQSIRPRPSCSASPSELTSPGLASVLTRVGCRTYDPIAPGCPAGVLVYAGSEIVQLGEKIVAVPWTAIAR